MLKWEDLVSHRWCRRPLVAESCPPLCDPMDCAQRTSSVHGIAQARLLEGVAVSFSRASSQPVG